MFRRSIEKRTKNAFRNSYSMVSAISSGKIPKPIGIYGMGRGVCPLIGINSALV